MYLLFSLIFLITFQFNLLLFLKKKVCIALKGCNSDTCHYIFQNLPLVLPHAWKLEQVAWRTYRQSNIPEPDSC